MSTHEHDRHNRAAAPGGALSPGSTATGGGSTREQWRAEYGLEPPTVPPSPADPDALIRGQRVTTAHDMEPGSEHHSAYAPTETSVAGVQPAGPAHADADLKSAKTPSTTDTQEEQ
ncbi:hypothetical protein FVA74_11345 [Salinibacterium sp. dk2585]|uniref:hypothetical protein n=1 Tax=unclassified Salinibacterium TaxID=2632331 RepID=UPI0011C24EB1|nr:MULTISPECIES: hypothetical protein [unclassified Salinibacterium]QEE62096.1 hypothetical protein FVA74_11345 [Salinibacterium sp. dk2585]TXK53448.1 hypothetical protein FVP63_09615 [Salinibacterium sp. dk5596]